MTTQIHNSSFKQVQLNEFDSSSNFLSVTETTLTTAQRATFHYGSPSFSSSCKSGYSVFSDPYNWRRPEEPDDCSRADIKRACRLGMWY